MDKITQLAQLSVLRASGFSGLAILMVMMGTASDPAASLRYGAMGLITLSSAMWLCAHRYPRRRRIDETEVWIMLTEAERPPIERARVLIVAAMREQLVEKARWWLLVALAFLALSALVMAFGPD